MSDSISPKHFVRINGKILGPFGQDQLRSLKSRGRLHPDHEVSIDRRTWLPATSLVDLFGEPAGAKQSTSSATSTESTSAPIQVEWFYAVGDEQHGPIGFKELRRLASQGKINHRDLVWHSGLDEWIPAGDQPGLIFPSRTASNRRNSGSTIHGGNQTQFQTFLWDMILELLRENFAPRQLQRFVQSLTSVGGFCLTLSMFLGLVLSVTLAIKLDSVQIMFTGLGMTLIASVLKFVGIHSIHAGDSLIRSTPNQMSSAAAVNMASVILLATGILLFTSSIYRGIYETQFDVKVLHFIVGCQFLFVLMTAASFLLQMSWMNVEIVADSRAGQEGLAILSFVLKLIVRISTFTFAVSSLLAAVSLGVANIIVIFSEDYKDFLSNIYSLGYLGFIQTVASGAAPLFAYLLFVTGSIFLDVCQSLITPSANLASSGGHTQGMKSGGSYNE